MCCTQQLCQFDEDYAGMLRELSLASALDPGWAVVREKREETKVFLLSMTNLVASKAREPLEELVTSLRTPLQSCS